MSINCVAIAIVLAAPLLLLILGSPGAVVGMSFAAGMCFIGFMTVVFVLGGCLATLAGRRIGRSKRGSESK